MKTMKILGLAAVAAAALTASAGAGTASATELTCGEANHSLCAVGQTLHAESQGKIVLDAPFGNVECESTMHGDVTNPGAATETAKASLTALTFTNCPSNLTIHLLAPGSIEFHTQSAANNGDGRVTGTGTRITVTLFGGVHCIYETKATDLGTLTGSTGTGGHSIVDFAASLPRVGGFSGVFCGASSAWTGKYTFKTPKTLVVD